MSLLRPGVIKQGKKLKPIVIESKQWILDFQEELRRKEREKEREERAKEREKREKERAAPPVREWDRDKIRQSKSRSRSRERERRRRSRSAERHRRERSVERRAKKGTVVYNLYYIPVFQGKVVRLIE